MAIRRGRARVPAVCAVLALLLVLGGASLGGCPPAEPTDTGGQTDGPGPDDSAEPGDDDGGTTPDDGDDGDGSGAGDGDSDGADDDPVEPPATLEGAWEGPIAHVVRIAESGDISSNGLTIIDSAAVTFDAAGRPDVLPLALGFQRDVIRIRTAGLEKVGDISEQEFPLSADTLTLTATVTSVAAGPTAYNLVLDLDIRFAKLPEMTESGVYSLGAALGSDGLTQWESLAELELSGNGFVLPVTITSSGTLAQP